MQKVANHVLKAGNIISKTLGERNKSLRKVVHYLFGGRRLLISVQNFDTTLVGQDNESILTLRLATAQECTATDTFLFVQRKVGFDRIVKIQWISTAISMYGWIKRSELQTSDVWLETHLFPHEVILTNSLVSAYCIMQIFCLWTNRKVCTSSKRIRRLWVPWLLSSVSHCYLSNS